MEASPNTTFWQYQAALWKKFWEDLRHDVASIVIALVLAVIVAVLQATFGFTPPNRTILSVVVNAGPYFVLLISFIAYHGLRAPWRLHNVHRTAHSEEMASLHSDLGKTLDSLKATVATMRP